MYLGRLEGREGGQQLLKLLYCLFTHLNRLRGGVDNNGQGFFVHCLEQMVRGRFDYTELCNIEEEEEEEKK